MHFMLDVLYSCQNCVEAEQFANVTAITILFSMQYIHSSITHFLSTQACHMHQLLSYLKYILILFCVTSFSLFTWKISTSFEMLCIHIHIVQDSELKVSSLTHQLSSFLSSRAHYVYSFAVNIQCISNNYHLIQDVTHP